MTAIVAEYYDCDEDRALFVGICLHRHLMADWGDLDRADTMANNRALREGGRLFSAYSIPLALVFGAPDRKLWVVTERDRSVTTVLFPSEY